VVKLRLMRMGKKKQPSYRIVATDSRSPRDGRFIEILGHYNPRQDPPLVTVDNDKVVGWLQQGAQPTDTVRKLLEVSGAWGQFKGEAPPAAAPAAESEQVPS
jgi:small subunit ribosomal protein S16